MPSIPPSLRRRPGKVCRIRAAEFLCRAAVALSADPPIPIVPTLRSASSAAKMRPMRCWTRRLRHARTRKHLECGGCAHRAHHARAGPDRGDWASARLGARSIRPGLLGGAAARDRLIGTDERYRARRAAAREADRGFDAADVMAFYSAARTAGTGRVRRRLPGRNSPAITMKAAQPASVSHSGAKLPAPS
jgi:hypothetical protein